MSDPLYRKDLLRLAADANGAGRLASPDLSGFAYNPACGDKVVVDLRVSGAQIVEFAHDTRACVLAQASASILGATLGGTSRSTVETLRASIVAMLEHGTAPPPAPFDSYGIFAGAIEYRSRHRCVLLPLDATLDALGKRG